jgi:hypothetical protein
MRAERSGTEISGRMWDHAANAFLTKNIEVPACTSGDSFATGATNSSAFNK